MRANLIFLRGRGGISENGTKKSNFFLSAGVFFYVIAAMNAVGFYETWFLSAIWAIVGTACLVIQHPVNAGLVIVGEQ
tara:strand:- start:1154 stop:1387 length:234 start_codon:yes stop_codon:yes gene_type:complete